MPELDLEKIKKAILNNKNKAIAGAGLIGLAAIGGIAMSSRENENPNDNSEISISSSDVNSTEYDYVVQYLYTNEYKELPKYNKIQNLKQNTVVIITDNAHIVQGGYYNYENGIWQEVIRENAIIQTPWIVGKATDYNEENQENEGFIPFEYVDIYAPYKVTDKINFRNEPSTEKGKETVIASLQNGEDVFIFDNSEVIQNDNHMWKKALITINGRYETGYIATDVEAMQRDFEQNSIGIMNTDTFLRKNPIVSELDERIISGQVSNGKKLKIIETSIIGKEVWHKCLIEGEQEYMYLSDLTIKPINEFETVIELPVDGANITNKDGSDIRKSVTKGSVLKVDKDNTYAGKYEVMLDTEEGCTVGYMDAAYLELSPTQVNTPYIITDITEGIGTTQIQSQQQLQTQLQIQIQTQTQTQSITSNQSTTQANLPTTTYTQPNKKDKLVYQLDIGWAGANPEAFIKNIDEFMEKDEIAGVYFEIGISSSSSNNEKLFMHTLGDDDEEFLLGESADIHLIATDVQKLKQKSTNGRIENGTDYLGKITNIEKCINEAIKRDIPFGLYYYQGAADSNRASAEAAYIYSVVKKLKYDMGDKYINARKLPIMIDIEKTYSAAALNEERLEAMNKTIRLLGNGENTEGCWTINDDKSYNILNDYNNQVTLYFDINGENQGLGYTNATLLNKINDLNQNGYKTIINTTRSVDGVQLEGQYGNLYGKKEMFNAMKQNKYYIGIPQLVDISDVIQCGLDMRKNGNTFDFSLTTQNTIDEIANGTYVHDKKYFDKIQTVIDKEKNILNTRDERE